MRCLLGLPLLPTAISLACYVVVLIGGRGGVGGMRCARSGHIHRESSEQACIYIVELGELLGKVCALPAEGLAVG